MINEYDMLLKETNINTQLNNLKKQRKIEKLRRVPLKDWSKEELLELIIDYNLYISNEINSARNLYALQGSYNDLYEFIVDRIYEKRAIKEFEEMKKE
ncbi:hypothetical protein [uncultured Clostridium sp.]|jgi:hypothetical protein|uniref:hypothetical protein n=1 Tax=uncultured Clostridium sp. TaxID=59620 RepID=UPI00272A8847|nr:hypothetical protein [uncultured Clostridium sp.]